MTGPRTHGKAYDPEAEDIANSFIGPPKRKGPKPKPGGNQHHDPDDDSLDENELIFIEAYFSNGFNTSKAALEAGYSYATAGYAVRKRPHVAKVIYERMQSQNISAPEIAEKVGRIARADIKHWHRIDTTETQEVDPETGEIVTVITKTAMLDLVKAIEDDNSYAITSVEYYRDGTPKRIWTEPKLKALELIGQVFGMFGSDKDDPQMSVIDRIRSRGYDTSVALLEMAKVAQELGLAFPKELIEGTVVENAPQNQVES